jgi:autotransporter translocation and assembly factor TamB
MVCWLFSSESGLQTTLWFISHFTAEQFNYKTAKGTLWTRVTFTDVQLKYPDFYFKADQFSFDPNLHTLFRNRVYLNNLNFQKATIRFKQNMPIQLTSSLTALEFNLWGFPKVLKVLQPGTGELIWDQSAFKWTLDKESTNKLLWNLTISNPNTLSVESEGFLNIKNPKNVQGSIEHLKLNFHSPHLSNLNFYNIDIHDFNFSQLLDKQELQATLDAHINDLKVISMLFPVIARPSGEIHAELKLKGSLQDPILALQARLDQGYFALPKYKMKIKELALDISGDILKTLTLSGSGHSGDGQFRYTGHASPFMPDSPNELQLVGKNVQLHNTADMFIIASPEVKLTYKDHALFIEGIINIPQGAIIERENMNIIHSHDVILLNNISKQPLPSPLTVYPSVQLIIQEGFRFLDNKLDIILKGKLSVEKRWDGLYAGNGRLTIVSGQYHLESGVQYINRGRLLFVTGTLLNDPLLDIKTSSKASPQAKDASTLYVYGTLKKPKIQFFETSQQQFENLAKLGVSVNQPKSNEAQDKARFLATGTNPLIEKLQNKVGFQFGFDTKVTQTNLDAPFGRSSTVFVIGKPLTENLSIQFLQGIQSADKTSTGRLKYSLSEHWDATVEHGSDGTGADLTFSVESDR